MTQEIKQVRRIINDISFTRFINELVQEVSKHPKCKLEECSCGDDKRAENAFMFSAVINYVEEVEEE